MEPTSGWPDGWTRAALGTAILAALEAGPAHGYAIAATLQDRGFGRPRGGSLYPLLSSLEEAGAVSAVWQQAPAGPGRRVNTLTAAGVARLHDERRSWRALMTALEPVLVDPGGDRS